ncbi:MAG: hypothetical protein MK101_11400, partial [Phycisphaerales bacterium]|nr:hypothetical protein [Phycisphaerales bacterium]
PHMQHPPPGRIRSIEALRTLIDEEAPGIEALESPHDGLATPIDVCGRTLRNRFCIHPMEGWDGTSEGRPTQHTLRRWRRFGLSGADLIWGGEAWAVQADGRANPAQLWFNRQDDPQRHLAALRSELLEGRREAGLSEDHLLLGLQLTHSGRFSRPTDAGAAPLVMQHHPVLEAKYDNAGAVQVLTDDDLKSIRDDMIDAAAVAQSAGFEFVDIKCAHGYLLHESLSARHRSGPYGGDLTNRTRLVREIIEGVRSRCPDLHIGVRLSVTDVPPHEPTPDTRVGRALPRPDGPYDLSLGVDPDDPMKPLLQEPLEVVGMLRDAGVSMLNVTVGSPYWCPHVQRPATYPPSDGYLPPEHPLKGVLRHLETTRAVKSTFPDLTIVGSGYSYLQEWLPHIAAAEVASGGTDLVGLGRMVLSYPHLPRDIVDGKPMDRTFICRTFSDCTTGPRTGEISGCYPLDAHYKTMPQAVTIKGHRRKAMGRQ